MKDEGKTILTDFFDNPDSSKHRMAALHQRLLEWYDNNARILPWRGSLAGTRDAYVVWLSEILLQQTQVSRASVYFQTFLEAFPTMQDLAAAPLEVVLKLWEGAGYYARARNLHQAAGQMATQGIPNSADAWLALPGVGRYTAAAIASLTRNEAVATVDGNIRRVLSRLENNAKPNEDWLWATATTYLEHNRAGAWNEALIELGATICSKKPRCLECPVAMHCQANLSGTTSHVPAPKPRATITAIDAVALIWHWQGRVLLLERPKKGLLGGLYGVPLESITTTPEAALAVLVKTAKNQKTVYLGNVSHTMTHRQFSIEVYALAAPHPALENPKTRAIANLDKKILVLLEQGVLFTPV